MSSDKLRTEHDLLGSREIPAEVLYGIHTVRALENFSIAQRTCHTELIQAFARVKQACATTIHELNAWSLDSAAFAAISKACDEIAQGEHADAFPTDALQGGAGTSLNMNVNEVIANRALVLLGKAPGDYELVDPIREINRFQSTNDTYPTAAKLAAISLIAILSDKLASLQEAFQGAAERFKSVIKVGRTQYQDAVFTTLGAEMACYAEVLGRDRARIHQCVERLSTVNLGGTAIGTGCGAPQNYIQNVVATLQKQTGFAFTPAKNLMDATQNCDSFVETSSMLKTCASNLIKMCTDLRLLSSGPKAGLSEISLPPRQAGSSIMPGKVNPVVPEAVTQAAIAVIANDMAITQASSLGSLELNPFVPLMTESLLTSIKYLTQACPMLEQLCVRGIMANESQCLTHSEQSTALATALSEHLGYKEISNYLLAANSADQTLSEYLLEHKLVSADFLAQVTSPESVLRLGSPINSNSD